MTSEVTGIPLTQFEEPIRTTLQAYSDLTDGRLVFDVDQAAQLELTLDQPNSARSSTPVQYLGATGAASLSVIILGPKDGTGSRSTRQMTVANVGGFNAGAPIIPRAKHALRAEAHLTIATQAIDSPRDKPTLFAGNLTMLGLANNSLMQIGEAGQGADEFSDAARGVNKSKLGPTATLIAAAGMSGERFGDPHALYNNWEEFIQICAFLAISTKVPADRLSALRLLRATEPLGYDEQQHNGATYESPRYYTSTQAAKYLGCSLATIRRWSDAGKVDLFRTPGGQRRYTQDALDKVYQVS